MHFENWDKKFYFLHFPTSSTSKWVIGDLHKGRVKLDFSHMTKKTLIHKLEHVAFQTEQASGFLLLDFYFDMLWNFHEKANLQFSEVS